MNEPTQSQVDSDLQTSMDLFERADVGVTQAIPQKRPGHVLLVLDGSTQDAAAVSLAIRMKARLSCQLTWAFVPTADSSTLASDHREMLNEATAKETSTNVSKENDTANQILQVVTESAADMLIVPCPFGRDFEEIGEDSTGTVIDLLAARCKIPFIAIRRPDIVDVDPTGHVRLILTGENAAAELAASFAAGLVQPDGKLELLLLVEVSFYQNFRQAMHAIDPSKVVTYEDLEHALARQYGRLHASLQHTADEVGFAYELLIRNEEDETSVTPEDPVSHPAVMVLGAERGDHDSLGEIRDFIRRCPHAVLVAATE